MVMTIGPVGAMGSKSNDPDAGTGIEKAYSKDFVAKVIRRRKKSKISATTNSGARITGSFFIPDDVRPSDFLRNMDIRRILLVEASINGIEQLSPVLIIIDNCEFITLIDDFASIMD